MKCSSLFCLAVTALLSLPALADDTTLDTVVVSASRDAMPLERVGSSITILTAEEIAERGYTSLADLLDTTTGVSSTNTGGSGKVSNIMIRGEEGFRTRILIDGVDVANTTATQMQPAIENISLADIERIEILRGPQGMMYGADAGGVINIITKRADKPFSANVNTEYGSYNTHNTDGSIRGKNDRVDYSVSFSRQDTDGFNSWRADTNPRDNDGYGNSTLDANAGMKLTDTVSARYTLRQVNASNDYDNCFDPVTFASSNICINSYQQQSQQAELLHNDGQFSNKFTFADSTTDTAFYTNGIRAIYYTGDKKQAQYLGTFAPIADNKLLYGIDYTEDRLNDTNDLSVGNIARNQTGAYAEWQGAIGKQFFYTLGDRNDDSSDFGSHNSYRATAAWLSSLGSDQLKYKASYGTGFRAPSLYEIAYNQGPFAFPPASTTHLVPETSKGFDAGVEYHTKDCTSVELVYFDQQVDNAIDFDLTGFAGYLQTPGTTRSKGMELTVDTPLNKQLSAFGNYMYDDTHDESGQQRIRRPRNSGNAGLRYHEQRWTLLGSMHFANDTSDQVGGTRVALGGYQRLDLSATYAVNRYLDIYGRGQNILDKHYTEVSGYNTERAAFYIGIRARY